MASVRSGMGPFHYVTGGSKNEVVIIENRSQISSQFTTNNTLPQVYVRRQSALAAVSSDHCNVVYIYTL